MPFVVCLRLIVNRQQNEKMDEQFTVSQIIFRQIVKSLLTDGLFVKCMFVYLIRPSSFRLIAKSVSAYRQTEENSFVVSKSRILRYPKMRETLVQTDEPTLPEGKARGSPNTRGDRILQEGHLDTHVGHKRGRGSLPKGCHPTTVSLAAGHASLTG